MKEVRFADIEDFCDDPALDCEVIATLKPEKRKGFWLSITAGEDIRRVVYGKCQPIYFSSIEVALARLVDVPNLCRRITIDLSDIAPDTF